MLRTATLEQSRGMKVRSSVKKLCDGCKVRPSFIVNPGSNYISATMQSIVLCIGRPRPILFAFQFLYFSRHYA